MILTHIAAAIATLPLLFTGQSAIETAQANDPYADWIYLYEDTFEDGAGRQITQQWWLEPNTERQSNQLTFRLLAQRSPASNNGTVAALFDYIANCDGMMYSIERAEFLDANNLTLDTQTYQRAMDVADVDSEFYGVLDKLCRGTY